MSSPLPPLDLPDLPDGFALVAVDMDGTLLDGDGQIPAGLWPLLERLEERGVVLVPASGRQYATLRHQFGAAGKSMAYIAENGAHVVHDGVEVSSSPLPPDLVVSVVADVRAAAADGVDLGAVVCGTRSAYVERDDERFLERCRPYYRALQVVADLDDLPEGETVVKVAVHDFEAAERTAGLLASYAAEHRVVVSGEHWVDVMRSDVDKGRALTRLQADLGIGPERTLVFGDYLNDLEMMDAALGSFAMANAHPDVLAAARHVAPPHTEGGVLQVLEALLDDAAPVSRGPEPGGRVSGG